MSHTCYAARPEAVTNGEGNVVLGADVQDLVPVGVCKVLYMLQQAQLHHTSSSYLSESIVAFLFCHD